MEGKKEFIEKVKAQLNELEAQMDKLMTKSKIAKDQAAVDYKKMMLKLQDKKTAMENKLNELKGAGEDSWQGLKTGVEKAYLEVKKAYEDLKMRFH